jgi:hypothetical protein
MAVVLGAAVLAVPGTALAKGGPHGKDKAESHAKAHKHEKKAKKQKKAKKAPKAKMYVFRGVYKGDGVVTVASGNGRVRKGGYVGQDVTFDLAGAKLIVADTDGVPGITAADVQAGDVVLVQARLPRGTKAPVPAPAEEAPATETTEGPVAEEEAPAAIKARKLIDKTHPPVDDDDAEEPAPAPAPAP